MKNFLQHLDIEFYVMNVKKLKLQTAILKKEKIYSDLRVIRELN